MGNKGFTLVELLVVITILAILWTIWFISLQWYGSESRDSKRISDLWQIRTGLQIEQSREWKVPMPDNAVSIWSWTTILTYQWYAGTGILNEIRVSDTAKDPLEDNYYTYTINWNKTKFQLLSMLENWETAYSNNLITQTYANYEDRYAYTTWDPVWTLLEWTTKIPVQESTSVVDNKIDLSTDTQEYIPVFSRENNSTTSSWSELVTKIVESTDNSGSTEETGWWSIEPEPDTTAPIWWSFTINWWATETTSTNVTLNITCATDNIDSTVEMYLSWDITWTPTWETCATSKNVTLTSLEWTKTVSVKFRDSSGNESLVVNDSINYITYNYSWYTSSRWSCSQTCWWWTKTRNVYCNRSDWTQVSDSYCSESKPSSSTSCNTQACYSDSRIENTYNSSQTAVYRCDTNKWNIYFRYAYWAEPGNDYLYFYPVSPDCTIKNNTNVSWRQECLFYATSSWRRSIYLWKPTTLNWNLPSSLNQRISNSYDCNNYSLKSWVTASECDNSYSCIKVE